MTKNHNEKHKPWMFYLPVVLLASLAFVVCLRLVSYRPDRPVATIVPASSSEPAFVVQVIRPRVGLPLGGLVPPEHFGLDAHLGFDSKSNGATVGRVAPGQIELGADDWDLLLVLDGEGRVTSKTQIVFDLVFEGRVRKVRCRPGDPVVGTVSTVTPGESVELSGNFDIELTICEDSETGTKIDWPAKPLVLHGSFDRLPLDTDTE